MENNLAEEIPEIVISDSSELSEENPPENIDSSEEPSENMDISESSNIEGETQGIEENQEPTDQTPTESGSLNETTYTIDDIYQMLSDCEKAEKESIKLQKELITQHESMVNIQKAYSATLWGILFVVSLTAGIIFSHVVFRKF